MEDHFRGEDPLLERILEHLLSRLRQLGPLRADAVQSSIDLIRGRHFGAVTVRKDRLILGFLTDEAVDDERVFKIKRLGPWKIAYHVALCSPDDVDEQLLGWLKRAYELG